MECSQVRSEIKTFTVCGLGAVIILCQRGEGGG